MTAATVHSALPTLRRHELTAVLLQFAGTNVAAAHLNSFYSTASQCAVKEFPKCSLQQLADITWAFHRAQADVPASFHRLVAEYAERWLEKRLKEEESVSASVAVQHGKYSWTHSNESTKKSGRDMAKEAANFLYRVSHVEGCVKVLRGDLIIGMLHIVSKGAKHVRLPCLLACLHPSLCKRKCVRLLEIHVAVSTNMRQHYRGKGLEEGYVGFNTTSCVQMPLFEVPGVWRKCELAVASLPPPSSLHQMHVQAKLSGTGAIQQTPEHVPDPSSQKLTAADNDPAVYWHSIQASTAQELAAGAADMKVADLTHFSSQVEAARMPEYHPILRAVHDALHEACLARSRSESDSCSSDSCEHVQSERLRQLQCDSATCSLKEVASAMKALSWQGMASDVVLQQLADVAKQILDAWGGTSEVAPNHLVDMILQIADSGTVKKSSCTDILGLHASLLSVHESSVLQDVKDTQGFSVSTNSAVIVPCLLWHRLFTAIGSML